jgi:mono/diheme cytochrome c family protein
MKAGLTLAGCVLALSAFAATAQDSPAPRTGEEIFAQRCVFCHDARGWGTRSLARRTPQGQAELLQREVLPEVLVRYAVRRGVGSMPQFTPTEISDAELDNLARWLSTRNAD